MFRFRGFASGLFAIGGLALVLAGCNGNTGPVGPPGQMGLQGQVGLQGPPGPGGQGTSVPGATAPFAAVSASSAMGDRGVFISGSPPTGAAAAPTLSNSVLSAFPGGNVSVDVSTPAPVDAVIVSVQGQPGFFLVSGSGSRSRQAPPGPFGIILHASTIVGTSTVLISTETGTTVSAPASLTVLIDRNLVIASGDLKTHAIPDRFASVLEGGSFNSAANTDNGAAIGQQPTGHREILWDGVPAAFTNTNTFPGNFFNPPPGSPGKTRGILFSTQGTGLRVSDNNFTDLNASYAGNFQAFTTPKTFSPIGSTITDTTFQVAGSATPATIHGMGVVFISVDAPNSSSLEFFDTAGTSVGKVFAPVRTPGKGPFSFAGGFFPNTQIARVRITSGQAAVPANDLGAGGTQDVVIFDDVYFSEPQAAGV